MIFNVALSLLIYVILANGFNAEQQCGDNGGKKTFYCEQGDFWKFQNFSGYRLYFPNQ